MMWCHARRKRPELDTSSATVMKVFLFVAALVSSAGGEDLDVLTECILGSALRSIDLILDP